MGCANFTSFLSSPPKLHSPNLVGVEDNLIFTITSKLKTEVYKDLCLKIAMNACAFYLLY